MPPDPSGPSHREEQILHYRAVRPLGAGGMGEVYLAQDERLGRRVALKFLPRTDSADPERRERLKREARALASLSHPGIAAVHALEEHEHRLFLVMEYVEGETLADRLARRPLPVPELIERGLVLAEAVAHAHGRGVIHRDIKPTNILITPDGTTKLADFGLALLEGETRLTAEGASAGTADHMSPEQTRGEGLDARSDLFSLGVVLYESLTGVRPFARPTLEAAFHAVRADEPEPPTALRSGIPLELERIVMKLLRKDPAERYQSAGDLAADLRALRSRESRLAEMPTVATAGSTSVGPATGVPADASRVPGSSRRSRRLLWALPALVVVAALVYLSGILQPRRGSEAQAASRSIAVLSFQHMADPSDSKREAAMAASLLTVGLAQTQTVPVLSNQRVSDVLRQLGKSGVAVTGSDALAVGRRAGATYVVVGYIYRTEPEYVVGAEVASTTDGAVLTSCRVEAPGGERGLFAAVDTLTMALREGLARAGLGVRNTDVDLAAQTTANPAAYRAYIRGVDLLDRNERPQAAEALEEAVRADSTFALAWYYLAVTRWWDEDFEGAKQAVDTPMRLGDRLVGRERESLGALRALIQGRFADAAQEYRGLLKRYPDDKEFLYGLGEALYHEGRDRDGALTMFRRTVELDPTFAVAYQHIVDVNLARGRFDAALADIERFRRVNPRSPAVRFLQVTVLGRSGRIPEMVSAAREVLAEGVTPGRHAAYRLATYFRMIGEFDSCRAYLERIQPGAQPGFLLPGDVYLLMSQGRYAQAAREARQRLQGNVFPVPPQDFPTVLALIKILIHERKYEEAWILVQRLRDSFMATHPNTGGAFEMTGHYAFLMGRLADAEQALHQYDVLLRQITTPVESSCRDGLALDVAIARRDARAAARLLPTAGTSSPPETRDDAKDLRLANALDLTGDRRGSTAALERVVRRAPYAGDPTQAFPAMLRLAERYEQDGRKQDALDLYRRVAHQFRMAEPGLPELVAARAGITRIEHARAQAASRL